LRKKISSFTKDIIDARRGHSVATRKRRLPFWNSSSKMHA
jgi:hypothetical protein